MLLLEGGGGGGGGNIATGYNFKDNESYAFYFNSLVLGNLKMC
jgi:hypothetical protein